MYNVYIYLRVDQMDEQVEGSSEHEVQLVPSAAVPVQTGPGYNSLRYDIIYINILYRI